MGQSCEGCRDGAAFEGRLSMAFQPIVDLADGTPFAFEALVRGPAGEGAATVLAQVTDANRYAFDQQCRVSAITWAAQLGLADTGAKLSINFLPNAVYEPRACIRTTLAAAVRHGFPTNRIIFEFTEQEALDIAHILNILRAYKDMGFLTALDDFGAGFAGLGLLAAFQPDIVKLDMALIRGIDTDRVRRAIVANTLRMMDDLGVSTICEGIETEGELSVLQELGVRYAQGYLLARPGFETLPTAADPRRGRRAGQGGGVSTEDPQKVFSPRGLVPEPLGRAYGSANEGHKPCGTLGEYPVTDAEIVAGLENLRAELVAEADGRLGDIRPYLLEAAIERIARHPWPRERSG